MSQFSDQLLDIADKLAEIDKRSEKKEIQGRLDQLQEAVDQIGKSWSGSWIGYQSRVYYKGLQKPPSGARFSQEWGLKDQTFLQETVGDWVEYDPETVKHAVFEHAGNPDLEPARELSEEAEERFEEAKHEIASLLSTLLEDQEDSFLESVAEDVREEKIFPKSDLVEYLRPNKVMTRDRPALDRGLQVPPHIDVGVEITRLRQPFEACRNLAKIARRAASHVAKRNSVMDTSPETGTHVFIGHGRSLLWRELKDFIQDDLGLPWDEFNRVPVAGVSNVARLSEMLDNAAIAFLILTAEDERSDGKVQARQNVIHEAGLFQGRLGFSRAIVMLEEGCEEFSNIQGLGQIRFPEGNIRAAFQDVREVLEREGLIDE